jgi:Rad52/22 family double-strand break repair protein
MISRQETSFDQTGPMADPWAALAAPLPASAVAWRQDGRSIQRDGKYFARFVAYVEAGTVRERLDSVVPGEWNLTIELLPPVDPASDPEAADANRYAFKARLQILGVVREDVGTGKDYKQAATDAFKRAAVRFGVAHELYQLGTNWGQLDGDGKGARPLEDPQAAYDRQLASRTTEPAPDDSPMLSLEREPDALDVPPCPECGGRMWDNRSGKRNPKAPDFKCRDRGCKGVIWPAKAQSA